MKVVEVANVDFALRHFVLPLMRGIRDRGHEVVGVSADGPMLDLVRGEGFRAETVPMARSLSPRAQWRAFRALVKLLRAEKPDMVHGHMPISGFLARLAACVAGVPRVAYTCHGFLFNQPGPLPRRAVAFVIEWIAGFLTDIYLTVSTEEAADARRFFISRHATPVGNGRSPHRFHPDQAARARIRAELGVPEDRVAVAVVSRLVRHKGHPELLAAMRDVPNAELWVIGNRLTSDHGEDLEPYFENCGLGPRLRRLGYREDIPALLAAADIFALPSHFEGLPMSVIEAMLTGLPVVATDVRGPREQVVHGMTGLLVPPRSVAPLAAALARLTDDAGLRDRMGEAARLRALDLYDEERVINRTLDLLRIPDLKPPGLNAPTLDAPGLDLPDPDVQNKASQPAVA
jgi:glycosyltransferase involved in cell wall biosynthesis